MSMLAIASIPIFIIGLVIWKFKCVEIIAGYDENKVKDKDGMAKWVGSCLMITSIVMISLYFIIEKLEIKNGPSVLISVGVLLILLTITALGTRRYEEK